MASGMLVLPRITAPAALRRVTASASCIGCQPLNAGMPHVVGRPATLNASLTVIGKPSSGRRSPLAKMVQRVLGGAHGLGRYGFGNSFSHPNRTYELTIG